MNFSLETLKKKLKIEKKYSLSSSDGVAIGTFTEEEIKDLVNSRRVELSAKIKSNDFWIALSETGWNFDVMPDVVEPAEEPEPEPLQDEETVLQENPEAEEKTIVCPHCWHSFDLSEINFISQHMELIGDPVLGPEAQQRFLPSVLNEQGYAIDAKGMVCQDMACPCCHQKLPEALLDIPSSLFSIAGAPASGKSYYLTAMTWQLRKIFASQFDYNLYDTDATFNTVLNNYESILFLNRNEDEYVALPKTELQGNDYSHQIMLNGMSVDLPLPFIFTLTPTASNSRFPNPQDGMQNIILYDNAGEHFEPGRDQVTNMATRHLVHSDGILFLFDPIKDSRMVNCCDPRDPQVAQINKGANQLVLLNEMISRIKKYKGMKTQEKYDKPLVVIVPKYDAWKDSFPIPVEDTDFTCYDTESMTYSFYMGAAVCISYAMREKLQNVCPDLVAACEAFFSTVYYIPVSSLGRMPEYDKEKDMIAVKPKHLQPIWVEVPMLLQLCLAGKIPGVTAPHPDAVAVEQYKFTGNSLVYTVPNTTIRDTVPVTYCGYDVFSAAAGGFIRLPLFENQEPPEAHSDAGLDAFWKE